MANPALTIDVDAKTTKYDKAMKAIGDTADKQVADIESKFEAFDPQLNTENYTKSLTQMVAGFGLAGVAAGAVLTLVVNLNKALADTGSAADRVGLSLERYQQLKFGANALGVGDDEFTRSIDQFASKLQDAKFQANDLTRVFDANGVSVKNANGSLKDANTLLQAGVDIVKRAPTIQDAIQIGSFLGLSRDFSQSLKEAGDKFEDLAAQANAAGAVIDEATVRKAQQFTEEWNKASTIWGNSMKAAIGGILPLLNDAVNGAVKVVDAVKSAYDFAKSIGQFAVSTVKPVDFDTQKPAEINAELEKMIGYRDRLKAGGTLNPIENFNVGTLAAGGPDQGSNTAEALDKIIARLQAAKAAAGPAEKAIARVVISKPSINPGPKISSGSDSRDQFETTVDQLTKRTATINADTAATFQNNAAQAQFRAEFQLLTAIMRDGGEVTQTQIDSYEKLRQTMSAQQALTASVIQLTNEHSAAFLASSTNIAAATVAYDKARDSLSKINSASQQIGSALSSAFADAVVEGKNLNDVFSSLIKTLEKSAINSVFSSIFNAPAAGGLSPFAGLFKGILPGFASGTDYAPGGAAVVGENGPEIVNLPRGAQVVPNAIAAKSASGQTFSPVYQINAAGADSGTVARIQTVLATHARIMAGQAKSAASSQRFSQTGVS
jgi:hypothetical protein